MTSILDFLEARLAEDEAVARVAGEGIYATWAYQPENSDTNREVVAPDAERLEDMGNYVEVGYHFITSDSEGLSPSVQPDQARHIARHDPARVLREVAIKRDMLEVERPGFSKDGVVCNGHPGPFMNHGDYGPGYCSEPDEFSVWYKLAWAYKDHPDYNPEWADRTPRYDR